MTVYEQGTRAGHKIPVFLVEVCATLLSLAAFDEDWGQRDRAVSLLYNVFDFLDLISIFPDFKETDRVDLCLWALFGLQSDGFLYLLPVFAVTA